jgi:hypothetical protein
MDYFYSLEVFEQIFWISRASCFNEDRYNGGSVVGENFGGEGSRGVLRKSQGTDREIQLAWCVPTPDLWHVSVVSLFCTLRTPIEITHRFCSRKMQLQHQLSWTPLTSQYTEAKVAFVCNKVARIILDFLHRYGVRLPFYATQAISMACKSTYQRTLM